MTDFAGRLVARTRGVMPLVTPRTPLRFGPHSEGFVADPDTAINGAFRPSAPPNSLPREAARAAPVAEIVAQSPAVPDESRVVVPDAASPERSAPVRDEPHVGIVPERGMVLRDDAPGQGERGRYLPPMRAVDSWHDRTPARPAQVVEAPPNIDSPADPRTSPPVIVSAARRPLPDRQEVAAPAEGAFLAATSASERIVEMRSPAPAAEPPAHLASSSPQPAAPAEEAPPPVIVEIGSIEFRAAAPTNVAPPATAPQRAAALSLDAYLARRRGER
jgi:hypothetical protein